LTPAVDGVDSTLSGRRHGNSAITPNDVSSNNKTDLELDERRQRSVHLTWTKLKGLALYIFWPTWKDSCTCKLYAYFVRRKKIAICRR